MTDAERLRNFVDAAETTRRAQQHYFATRRSDALQESKRLERVLDRLIEEYEAERADMGQRKMF